MAKIILDEDQKSYYDTIHKVLGQSGYEDKTNYDNDAHISSNGNVESQVHVNKHTGTEVKLKYHTKGWFMGATISHNKQTSTHNDEASTLKHLNTIHGAK